MKGFEGSGFLGEGALDKFKNLFKCSRSVTNQTGAWPCGALKCDPTISVEGDRFYLQDSNHGEWRGGKGTPAQSPPFPSDPALPLLSKRL